MRQKFFSVPFAVSGDLTTVADPVNAGGLVTFTQGWGPKYSLDTADPLSLKIDRASTNYMFNVITGALAALQAVGTPEWITTADNDGVAYPYVKGAKVRYSATPSTGPWVYYVSMVDNNTSVPGADANWQVALQYAAAQSDVVAGTSSALIVTPLSLAGLIPALPVPINQGGTGQITAPLARGALGAAASGANSDITSLTGLTTPLAVSEGGTGTTTLTAHGVLLGEGTGSIGQTAVGSVGQMLLSIGGTGDPIFGNAGIVIGGSVNNTPVGNITPSSGAFTTLSATTPLPIASGGTGAGTAAAAISALGGVDLVNAQTVGGTKTFSVRPIVGTAAPGTNDTGAASTAFVGAAIAAVGATPKRTAPSFVNSGCLVAQRTSTPALTTARQIGPVDNVGVWASGGAVTSGNITQQVGNGPGIAGYAAVALNPQLTGAGQISLSIRMEAKDAIKYKNQTVSFSAKVAHYIGSTINFVLVANKPTVADNFASRTIIATSSAMPVLTGTTTTLVFNNVAIGDTSNGLELEVQAVCGAISGANKHVYATEFYINTEATAGTYDALSYKEELAQCQRYLPGVSAFVQYEAIGVGQASVATGAIVPFMFSVPARVGVTGLIASAPGNFSITNAGGNPVAATSLTLINSGVRAAQLNVGVTAGLVVGNATSMSANTANSQLLFTGAEL